jgi:uncharacterized protein YihD (DUF1040 family)
MQQEGQSKIINLLSGYFGRYELRKQKAVWLSFGVDYEAEKAKQEAIWQQFQAKTAQKKVGGYLFGSKYVQRILEALESLDPQEKRLEALRLLEKLAKYAYNKAMQQDLDDKWRLRWANIAIYALQTINGLLARYEDREVLRRFRKLKEAVDELRRETAGKT